jgi:DNA-binding beta-propeller fold protein YncE
MAVTRWIVLLVCSHGAIAGAADLPDFEPAAEFLQLPEGMKLAACAAVAVGPKGEIYVHHRGQKPILCFDAQGKYLRAWGEGLIKSAHGLRVDREGNVWATDWQGHRVLKFDPSGKVLLTLGTGVAGKALDQFDRPTDVAFGPRGEFFISDGYGNTRVFAPYGLAESPEGVIFVADGRANQVLALDAEGKVQRRWGEKGKQPGQFELPHMLAFDAAGNLYVAEVNGKRVQRFLKSPR